MIPERFQANCHFCHDPLDIRKPGVRQLQRGWVQNRTAGGGNAIELAEKLPYWACKLCMEDHKRGQARYQMGLFT
jgi:hypothetical protein